MCRIAVLLTAAAIVALAAVGCSDDATTDQPQPPQSPPPATEQQRVAIQPQQQTEQPQQPEQPEQPEQAQPAQTADDQQAQPSTQQQPERAQQQEQPQQQVQQPEPETKITLGDDRPATLLLPQGVDRTEPRPLIVLLHGYSSFSAQADQYFQFSQWVDEGEFGVLFPDGTIDEIRNRFWNATPECCDIFGAKPDDVGYIKSLIEEARTLAAFDQVFAVGHSNGGFMAYRLACEDVPGLRGIVSLAGGAFANPADCRVPTPLSVLQIHGTKDAEVLYEGGRLPSHPDPDRQPVPGAKASVLRWAERAGCDLDAAEKLSPIDTDTAVDGAETSRYRYTDGCADGVRVELWTIDGGSHIPLVWGTDFTPGILEWLAQVYGLDVQLLVPSGAAEDVDTIEIGGQRPAQLLLPADRDAEPLPLILSLHGYSGEASAHDWYFGLSERIPQYRFALITPQGTTNSSGLAFWNATDACCNFDGSEVDDFGWLSALVAEAREIVDISGVHVVGYSNGGFMAYRLACAGLEGLVSIVSLAGSSFGDPDRCADAAPVSVLQIHGSADLDIPYDGSLEYEGGYPGALALTERWAQRAGCDLDQTVEPSAIDLDRILEGAETIVRRYRDGCGEGITVELWTITGADHYPFFNDEWPDRLVNWLFNESRTN